VCNTDAMNLHLVEIARTVTLGAHAVVIMDQAGWHSKRRLRLSITHKFCFFGCAGHFEAFGEGFEAFEAAPNDCCAWRRVLGSIEIAAQSCDGGDEELQIARC